MKREDRAAARLLIVDDNSANLGVLYNHLDRKGYRVLVAQDGKAVIPLVEDETPDLILLDVMLPDISGFEICRRLKENPVTRDVPVIFISALASTEDKIEGFRAGGVDYITKPFQQDEVLARVEAHLTIKKQREMLAELNATKDRFFSIIAHDLRGPFTGFLGASRLLEESAEELDIETLRKIASELHRSAGRGVALLENLLKWAMLQQQLLMPRPAPVHLHSVVETAVDLFSSAAEQKGVTLTCDVHPSHVARADVDMISSAFRNLINNAVKFTPPGGAVSVASRREGDSVCVAVADTGVWVSEEDLPYLFRSDRKVQRKGTGGESGTGLGLVLVAEYVERNAGRIDVETVPGTGTTFTVHLPAESSGLL
ncbi:MAG: hybrid sensor histidine kinase/response regulator [Spirochaetaceae bacterium]|nr:MAG: hybrid sensor histidine kinase/response regulator [Spirochaetaceae bacterium]